MSELDAEDADQPYVQLSSNTMDVIREALQQEQQEEEGEDQ